MLKNIILGLIIAALIAGISACIHLYRVSVRNKNEMAKYAAANEKPLPNLGKTLVVYYSYQGHTRAIAEKIARMTNADLHEIKTKEPYANKAAVYIQSKRQLSTGVYPEIQENLPDLKNYQTVFVGAPVWWYTVAPAMMRFLKQTDFAGLRVVPFSTQGSNTGSFFKDFAAATKNAVLLKEESFNNLGPEYDEAVKNKISAWISAL